MFCLHCPLKFRKIIAILNVVLIMVSLCGCSIGKKEYNEIFSGTNIDFEITAQQDLASVIVYGGYIKIDLISPGLDTADITTVMYSIEDKKETGRVALGVGDWTTGRMDNGFFAVDNTNKKVYFYDFNGKKTFAEAVETSASFFATSYVSTDGKYLVYANPETGEICLYAFSDNRTYITGNFTGNTEVLAYSDHCFFIRSGAACMLKVSVKDKVLYTLFDYAYLNFVTKDGGTGISDDMTFRYVDANQPDTVKNINYCKVNEVVVNILKSSIVTVSSEKNKNVLRLYESNNVSMQKIELENPFLCCAETDNHEIMVCSKTGNGFHFQLYDLTNLEKTTILSDSEKEMQDGKIETTETESSELNSIPKDNDEAHYIQNVPVLSQMPKYPTGCESVSAVMALKYAGYDIDVGTFVDLYLQKNNDFSYSNGLSYGPDPNKYFIGNPRSSGSYGCFAPVISEAITSYTRNADVVVNATGTELYSLCKRYVDNDIPVIVWVTIAMLDTYPSTAWTLENGETFYWPKNEHCMLLIGYDSGYYYFNDPYVGKEVKYSRTLVETRYLELGKQAVIIM